MSIEIHFEENEDMNNYDCSGLPFCSEYSRDKDFEDEDFDNNPHGYYQKQNEELRKAADEFYENCGDEGWYGFLAGCRWYQEQLKKLL